MKLNSKPKLNYLFNFSSSYTGGGLIRLIHFLSYFDKIGGAYFILNSKLETKNLNIQTNNKIFFVNIKKIKRLLNDEYYLPIIKKQIPKIDLYYAYGVPVYSKVAKINWFHLSNMFTIKVNSKSMNFKRYLEMKVLSYRIKKSSKFLDFYSAESIFSTNELKKHLNNSKINSYIFYNGIPDTLLKISPLKEKKNRAVSIGTQKYKHIDKVVNIFDNIKNELNLNEIVIFGEKKQVPIEIISRKDVKFVSYMEHRDLLTFLSKSKIYISFSEIENSSTAVIEGLYLCEYTALSKIPSHLDAIKQMSLDNKYIENRKNYILIKNKLNTEILIKNQWEYQIKKFANFVEKILKT